MLFLIKTAARPRQIEKMLDKRAWRWRHANATRQPGIAAVSEDAAISPPAVLVFAPARKLHRPARAAKAATPAPVMSRNLDLRHIGQRYDDEAPAPR